MTGLPEGLSVSFLVAASELGMATASRIFVEEIARVEGERGVEDARDVLGRLYPVFDAIASSWLEHGSASSADPADVMQELEGVDRVLIVGAEADGLDQLVPRLSGIATGIVADAGGLEEDLARVAMNYPGRLEIVPLGDWARWAGPRSALLTFVYGADDHVANVSPAYLRLVGPDVRAAFRSLVGWNLLGGRPRLHPLYLMETSVTDFSTIVGPGATP